MYVYVYGYLIYVLCRFEILLSFSLFSFFPYQFNCVLCTLWISYSLCNNISLSYVCIDGWMNSLDCNMYKLVLTLTINSNIITGTVTDQSHLISAVLRGTATSLDPCLPIVEHTHIVTNFDSMWKIFKAFLAWCKEFSYYYFSVNLWYFSYHKLKWALKIKTLALSN